MPLLLLRPCSLLRLCSCGLPSANLSSRTLVFTKLNVMRTDVVTYSRRAVPKTTDVEKGEECDQKQEDVAHSKFEMEQIWGDTDRLQSMTVKELRELTRRVGVSARGSKKELVSALMTSLHRDVNGDNGSSSAKQVSTPSVPSKRKGGVSVVGEEVESLKVISEASRKKRSRRKQQSIESTSVDGNSVSSVKLHQSSVQKKTIVDQAGVAVTDEVGLEVEHVEPWTILVHKKPQSGWIPYNPKIMRPPPLSKDTRALKLMSWNVNGLKALLKSKSFSPHQLAQREDFDVLCLQETKIQEKDIEDIKESLIEGYSNSFWTCSISKLGYSGAAIISRVKPISIKYGLGVPDHDSEGRLVTVEFDDFYLITAYVPNSGDGLRRLTYRVKEWDPSLGNYMKELEKSKPVILTGDLNCAHEEIDIHDPAGNRRSAGFTYEERESFETNFLSKGFVDTFRKQNPNVVAYSYWGYRHNGRKTNKGWRLDYFLVSESIAERVHDSYILPEIAGSDHSPIGLVLKL